MKLTSLFSFYITIKDCVVCNILIVLIFSARADLRWQTASALCFSHSMSPEWLHKYVSWTSVTVPPGPSWLPSGQTSFQCSSWDPPRRACRSSRQSCPCSLERTSPGQKSRGQSRKPRRGGGSTLPHWRRNVSVWSEAVIFLGWLN